MILGGHVSAAGGVLKALERAQALEFTALQIHPTAPQTWRPPTTTPEEAEQFKQTKESFGIQASFFHNIYLINFAAPDEEHWQKSIAISKSYMQLAQAMGVDGVVTHTGSHKGLGMDDCRDRVVEGIHRALAELPETSCYLIENTAGEGGKVGRSLEEIELLIEPLWKLHKNVGICIDTCHSFAAGVPIHTAEGLDAFLAEFEERFGLAALRCIHLNDSKGEFNSHIDRHENIGDGKLSSEAIGRIINHPKLANVPFIMEVPGLDGNGPDAPNRDKVRALFKG